MKKYILIGPILLIILWFIISQLNLIDRFFLPSPIDTFKELINLIFSGSIIPDFFVTFYRVLISFFIALIIGIPLGLFLGSFKKLYQSLEFIIDFFRSFPPLAIFPVFLLIFGISDYSKIAVAVFGTCLIIIFNTAYGVFNSTKSRITAARLMGAKNFHIFKSITFFECLPQIFIGLRGAISMDLMIIIVTEMFIGTNYGLGHRIIDSQIIYNIKAMYATIIIAGVLGYLLNYIFLYLEKRLIHWSGK